MNDQHKINCWEHFKCGREVGNPARRDSPCNVSLISIHNHINGGENAGRYCWTVEGSYCAMNYRNEVSDRGTIDYKETHCDRCEFKKIVMEQEGEAFLA